MRLVHELSCFVDPTSGGAVTAWQFDEYASRRPLPPPVLLNRQSSQKSRGDAEILRRQILVAPTAARLSSFSFAIAYRPPRHHLRVIERTQSLNFWQCD